MAIGCRSCHQKDRGFDSRRVTTDERLKHGKLFMHTVFPSRSSRPIILWYWLKDITADGKLAVAWQWTCVVTDSLIGPYPSTS